MSITAVCMCGKSCQVKGKLAGRKVKCPARVRQFTVPGVCDFVLGDGSVRSIAVSIDATTLNRLADGQPIGQF